MSHNYFGNEHWRELAPGLKTVEDALEMRRRILLAFETADRLTDDEERAAWMRFVIIGGGPTGVELSGAIAELARGTLRNDFRTIRSQDAEVILMEGHERVLPPFAASLSRKAQRALEKLGARVLTDTRVKEIGEAGVVYEQNGQRTEIATHTVLWSAGMSASPLGAKLAERTDAETDRMGRVLVEPDLSIQGHPEISVIGDLACCLQEGGKPLPGVAPVAMQQGRHVARAIGQRLRGRTPPHFRYRDKGSLAVIGRHAAVADFGALKISGFAAWLTWLFVHIAYLIEYDNKLLVLIQWGWNYFTRKRGARLITGDDVLPRGCGRAEG